MSKKPMGKGLGERGVFNKAVVATANENAWIIWAMMAMGGDDMPQTA